MANTAPALSRIQQLYPLLDQFQELLKVIAADYRLPMPGGGSSPLSGEQIQQHKGKYEQLRKQVESLAKEIPEISRLA